MEEYILYQCPYNAETKCSMVFSCLGCMDFPKKGQALKNFKYDNWNNIQDIVPEDGQLVLGISYGEVVLGFWNSEENCLLQYSNGSDGCTYSFTYWMPIPNLPIGV